MDVTYKTTDWRTPAAVGVASFAAGAALGYFVCKRRLETVIDIMDEIDVDIDIDDNQGTLDFTGPSVSEAMGKLADTFGDTVKVTEHWRPGWASDYPGNSRHTPPLAADLEMKYPIDPGETDGTLADPGPEPEIDDLDIEERTEDAPYVISVDEWASNEKNYVQMHLTWYAGDQILTDENHIPIYNVETLFGRLDFGRGSGDSDTVYIRNDSRKCEYEVVRVEKFYQREIMNIEVEEAAEADDLKHSRDIPRFRME